MQFGSRTSGERRYEEANQNHLLKWNISPFMPYRYPSSRPSGRTPVALCHVILALLHLFMVATAYAAHQTLGLPPPVTKAYLTAMTSPALRFREAVSTAPLQRKPVATGSPVAASAPELAEVALANDHAAASTPPMPVAPTEAPATETAATAKTEPAAKAQPILPDDTRRKVQSQDFLPLFRFPGAPGSNGDVIVPVGVPTPPAPGTLPPSSATYRQE